MKPAEFVQNALKTEHSEEDYQRVRRRLSKEDLTMLRVLLNRIAHLTMQLDMWKKKVFYGNTKHKVLDELDFAKQEHGYLADHLSSNHYTQKNISDTKSLRILHAIVGMVGESGELADAFGKFLKTGKLDEVNLKEELGDMDWYEAVCLNALKVTHEEVWRTNNEKLAARFGVSFNEKGAIDRNVDNERKILEQKNV